MLNRKILCIESNSKSEVLKLIITNWGDLFDNSSILNLYRTSKELKNRLEEIELPHKWSVWFHSIHPDQSKRSTLQRKVRVYNVHVKPIDLQLCLELQPRESSPSLMARRLLMFPNLKTLVYRWGDMTNRLTHLVNLEQAISRFSSELDSLDNVTIDDIENAFDNFEIFGLKTAKLPLSGWLFCVLLWIYEEQKHAINVWIHHPEFDSEFYTDDGYIMKEDICFCPDNYKIFLLIKVLSDYGLFKSKIKLFDLPALNRHRFFHAYKLFDQQEYQDTGILGKTLFGCDSSCWDFRVYGTGLRRSNSPEF